MRKPEPLAEPVLRAIARALQDGAHVARIRLSAQFLEGLLLEEEPKLKRVDEGVPANGNAQYTLEGYPVVVSRVQGWVLETWV